MRVWASTMSTIVSALALVCRTASICICSCCIPQVPSWHGIATLPTTQPALGPIKQAHPHNWKLTTGAVQRHPLSLPGVADN